MRAFCTFLLVLNIAYCLVASLTGLGPSWNMFQKVEPVEFRFVSGDGQKFDTSALLTQNRHILGLDDLKQLGRQLCRRFPDESPITLLESIHKLNFEFTAPDCTAHETQSSR